MKSAQHRNSISVECCNSLQLLTSGALVRGAICCQGNKEWVMYTDNNLIIMTATTVRKVQIDLCLNAPPLPPPLPHFLACDLHKLVNLLSCIFLICIMNARIPRLWETQKFLTQCKEMTVPFCSILSPIFSSFSFLPWTVSCDTPQAKQC